VILWRTKQGGRSICSALARPFFAEDISKTMTLSLRLMAKDNWGLNKFAVCDRSLFENSDPPNPISIKQERSPAWPAVRDRSASIPDWPYTLEPRNLIRRFWEAPEFHQPIAQLGAGKFIGV